MKNVALFVVLSTCSFYTIASPPREILQKEAQRVQLDSLLQTSDLVLGFPRYTDRDFWETIPQHLAEQYILEAEQVLAYSWPVIKATDYLEIIRTGDRLHEQFVLPHDVLQSLIMGELIEGKGRFLDQVINGAWYYSEQTWWGWSAHLQDQKEAHGLPDVDEPIIDLGAGEVANTLSMIYLLFKDELDKTHPLISRRIKREVMNKVIIPFYERDDFWWMGFKEWIDPCAIYPRRLNNWNTWINYNVLLSVLILEDDLQKISMGVAKILRSMDLLLNTYPDDGGCDEGPIYWGKAGGSMYQSLRLLNTVTRGSFNVYNNPLIINMGTYIYKACINYPYFLNFADANAIDYSYPDVIYLYGKDINSPTMQKFGAFAAREQGWAEKSQKGAIDRRINQLMHLNEILNAPAESPLISDFWLPDTEIAGARDKSNTNQGFYFAAKGGNNNESHNHNDVGTFVLYYNGLPCIIDLGREVYTAKTFSQSRYEIWTMQSQFHNLPRINGHDQAFGPNYKSKDARFTASKKKVEFALDIAGAYPVEAGVKKWNRKYTLERGKSFLIEDDYELSILSDDPTTLNFISYCKVSEIAPGLLELKTDSFTLHMKFDSLVFQPEITFIPITDERLFRFWPNGVTRVVLNYKNKLNSQTSIVKITKAD